MMRSGVQRCILSAGGKVQWKKGLFDAPLQSGLNCQLCKESIATPSTVPVLFSAIRVLHTQEQRQGPPSWIQRRSVWSDSGVETKEQSLLESIQNGQQVATDLREIRAFLESEYTGIPHNAETFVKKIQKILPGHDIAPAERQQINELFHWVIESWSSFKPPSAKRPQALLDYMEDVGMEPSQKTYDLVLATWTKVNNAEGAQALFDRMTRSRMGITVAEKNFIDVLEAWSTSKSPLSAHRAESLVQEMKRRKIVVSPICYLRLMECWARSKGQEKHVDTSLGLLGKIKSFYALGEDQWDPTILQTAILTMLKLYSKHQNAHAAETLLLETHKESKQHPIMTTAPMYITVFSTWARSKSSRRAPRAEKLLMKMLNEDGHPQPDVACFTAALNCWASSNTPGSAKQAERLLRKMIEDKHVQPNVLSFTCVLSAWSRSGDADAPAHVERIFEEMKNVHQIEPDRLVYGALISTWGRSNDTMAAEKADGYLQELQDLYDTTGDVAYQPTVVEYTATLQAWANFVSNNPEFSERAVERVDSLLQEMFYKDDHHCRPNSSSYAAVLKTIAASRGIDDKAARADHIIATMENSGVEVSNYIMGIVKKCQA